MEDLQSYLIDDDTTKDFFNELDYEFSTKETTKGYNMQNIEMNFEIEKVENNLKNLSMQCSSLQNQSIDIKINNNNNNNTKKCDTLEARCDLLEAPLFETLETQTQKTIFEERKLWVYDLIAKKIGLKWRLFGGGIGMREGDMDDLQTDFENIATRVHKMLGQLEVKEFYNYEKIYYKITQSLLEDCNVTALKDEIEFAMTK